MSYHFLLREERCSYHLPEVEREDHASGKNLERIHSAKDPMGKGHLEGLLISNTVVQRV